MKDGDRCKLRENPSYIMDDSDDFFFMRLLLIRLDMLTIILLIMLLSLIRDATGLPVSHTNSTFLPSQISELILIHMLTAKFKTYQQIREYFLVNL